MSSGATAEGRGANWEGSETGKGGASAPFGSLPADSIAEVVAGTDALTYSSYYELWRHGRGPRRQLGGF